MKFDLNKKITDFHYGKFSIFFFVLFLLPSFFYFLIISIKNFLYKIKILKEQKVKPYVICIGNLTTGGVGKTPVVIEIANYLEKKGKHVAVLSRGYGGKIDRKIPTVVRTENEILIDDPELVGDEVNLISKRVNNVSIVICSNRLKGAKCAESLGADVILMDDGFSNRKIFKDLTILLIDNKKMFGNGFLLPLGPLREPVCQLKRAQRILFVDKETGENKNLENFKKGLTTPYFNCKMKGVDIYNIKTGEKLEDGGKIVAFSGIGSPNQFYSKLKNFEIIKTVSFNDHFEYNQKVIDEIVDFMAKNNVKAAVTTEKDMVKILKFNNIDKIYALKLDVEINLDEILN